MGCRFDSCLRSLLKTCKHHGETDFVLEGRGYYRCKKCRSEAVQRRRDKVKRILVAEHGGACIRCGYSKCIQALQFHHRGGKTFGIADKGHTRSLERTREEAAKCDLLCANCHAEEHAEWLHR